MLGRQLANVSICVDKLSGYSDFIGMLREDSFRDFLVEALKSENMYIRYIKMTNELKTYLTFVSLSSEG